MNKVHDEKLNIQQQFPLCPIHGSNNRYSRINVASIDKPRQICGKAWRVGFTDSSEKYRLYRLKIKVDYASTKRTLPDLFVLDNNLFVNYNQWQQRKDE